MAPLASPGKPAADHFNDRLATLRRTIRRAPIVHRIAVWLALLMLSPIAFDTLVRRVPESWLNGIGMQGAYSWLGLSLILIFPDVIAAVTYSVRRSERANRLAPVVIAQVQSRTDTFTESELRSAAATLRSASRSRWCETPIRRDAAEAVERLEQWVEQRCIYPIPSKPESPAIEQLPLAL